MDYILYCNQPSSITATYHYVRWMPYDDYLDILSNGYYLLVKRDGQIKWAQSVQGGDYILGREQDQVKWFSSDLIINFNEHIKFYTSQGQNVAISMTNFRLTSVPQNEVFLNSDVDGGGTWEEVHTGTSSYQFSVYNNNNGTRKIGYKLVGVRPLSPFETQQGPGIPELSEFPFHHAFVYNSGYNRYYGIRSTGDFYVYNGDTLQFVNDIGLTGIEGNAYGCTGDNKILFYGQTATGYVTAYTTNGTSITVVDSPSGITQPVYWNQNFWAMKNVSEGQTLCRFDSGTWTEVSNYSYISQQSLKVLNNSLLVLNCIEDGHRSSYSTVSITPPQSLGNWSHPNINGHLIAYGNGRYYAYTGTHLQYVTTSTGITGTWTQLNIIGIPEMDNLDIECVFSGSYYLIINAKNSGSDKLVAYSLNGLIWYQGSLSKNGLPQHIVYGKADEVWTLNTNQSYRLELSAKLYIGGTMQGLETNLNHHSYTSLFNGSDELYFINAVFPQVSVSNSTEETASLGYFEGAFTSCPNLHIDPNSTLYNLPQLPEGVTEANRYFYNTFVGNFILDGRPVIPPLPSTVITQNFYMASTFQSVRGQELPIIPPLPNSCTSATYYLGRTFYLGQFYASQNPYTLPQLPSSLSTLVEQYFQTFSNLEGIYQYSNQRQSIVIPPATGQRIQARHMYYTFYDSDFFSDCTIGATRGVQYVDEDTRCDYMRQTFGKAIINQITVDLPVDDMFFESRFSNFMYDTFKECTATEITLGSSQSSFEGTFYDTYMDGTFENATNLTNLTLQSGWTDQYVRQYSANSNFMYDTFKGCTNQFNIIINTPNSKLNILDTQYNSTQSTSFQSFMRYTFFNSNPLVSSPYELNFTFQNGYSGTFMSSIGDQTFRACQNVSNIFMYIKPETNMTVQSLFYQTFLGSGVTNIDHIKFATTYVPKITAISNYYDSTYYNTVLDTTTQSDPVYQMIFNQLSPAPYWTFRFVTSPTPENLNASIIINGIGTPSEKQSVFPSTFSDYNSIAENWRI